jgi:hypothetical protein
MTASFRAAFWICLFTSVRLFSQSKADSIEAEILHYPDADLTILTNSRMLILDGIRADDIPKVRELLVYLDAKFDKSRVVAFWEEEAWLLLYWTGDYNRLLSNAKLFAPIPRAYYADKILPPRDMFIVGLKAATDSRRSDLLAAVRASGLKPFEKEFLRVLLEYLLMDGKDSFTTREKVNALATDYIVTQPDSYLIPFVQNYIRFVVQPSDWGFGLDFFSGYGSFTGSLGRHFRPVIPLGVAFEAQRRKVIADFRIFLGFGGKVLREFDYAGHWKKDLTLNVVYPELSLGYALIDNPAVRCYPFTGITPMFISPPEKIRKEPGNDVELNSGWTATVGFNCDLKFGSAGNLTKVPNATGYSFVRIRTGFSFPGFDKKIPGFSGNLFFVQIGYGGISRKLVRVL